MKILHIGKYLPPFFKGGIESYTYDLVKGLSKKADIYVAVSNIKFKPSTKNLDGIKIYFQPKIASLLEAPINAPPYSIISKVKPDIIHFHMPNPFMELYLLFYFALFGKKTKFVVTYHADAPHYSIIDKIADSARLFFARSLLSYADKIIVTSENYRFGSEILKNVNKRKIVVIPLGVDTNFKAGSVEKLKKRYGLKNEKIILFVGRLFPYKGLEYALKAMRIVFEKFPDTKFVISGSGELMDKLKKLSDKLELREKVLFTGSLPDIERNTFYKMCDVFVLPSINRGEAFGVSMLEAMTFSKPIVSTDIKFSGVNFVNINNKTGFVVRIKDEKQLAEAIIKLLSEESLRRRFGHEARKRVSKYFNKQLMIERTYDVYKDLLQNK